MTTVIRRPGGFAERDNRKPMQFCIATVGMNLIVKSNDGRLEIEAINKNERVTIGTVRLSETDGSIQFEQGEKL